MPSNSPEVARRVRRSSLRPARPTAGAVLAGVVLGALAAAAQSVPSSAWWAPGQGTPLPGYATYENERGHVGLLNTAGPIDTKGHPFFEPIGTNGRACVSCHQPSDGMALSLRSVRERWTATGGTDPLFAAVDGMNCPNLPAADARSHSLLLERGLFRIALPWPPKRVDGTPIEPEFTIEVVRDPSGCNADPVHGLRSATPTISVFRRPRPVANTKYTTHQNFGVGPFVGKNGMPTAIDPETGRPTSMNLMPAEARYDLTFEPPRPPGPSKGRLAFDPGPSTAPAAAATTPTQFVVQYDFDGLVGFSHPRVLSEVLDAARTVNARAIEIVGYRGSVRLSNGQTMVEAATIGKRRAEQVAGLLQGANLKAPAYTVRWQEQAARATGIDDYLSRRVVITIRR